MKRLTLIMVIALQSLFVRSQTITNVSSSQEGNNIKITYSISDISTPVDARINLYYSVNGSSFNGPLSKVSGDVGDKKASNGLKTITWDVLSEIGSLDGNVAFKVEIVPTAQKVVVPSNRVNNFELAIPSAKYSNGKLKVEFVITNFGEDVYGLLRGNEFSVTDATGTVLVPEIISFANVNERQLDKVHRVFYQNQVPFKIVCTFNCPDLQSKTLSSAFIRSNAIVPSWGDTWYEDSKYILFLISTKNIPIH